MKKTFIALALASFSLGLKADSVNVGQTTIPAYSTNAPQQASMVYGTDRAGNWNMLGVSADGAISISVPAGTGGMAVNVSQWAGTNVGPPRGLASTSVANTDIGIPVNAQLYGSSGGSPSRVFAQSVGSAAFTSGGTGVMARAQLGGWDGTNVVPFTARGSAMSVTSLAVSISMPFDNYVASFSSVAPAANATDIITVTGSGTQTIIIKKIEVSGVATVGDKYRLALLRRSTADSGGTATTSTAVTLDTGQAANTATFNQYSANPTLGTLVGQPMSNWVVPLSIAGAGVSTNPVVLFEATDTLKGIVLRGTSQQLAINGLGTSIPTGGLLDVNIWFDVL
jgi:hypothetical protein